MVIAPDGEPLVLPTVVLSASVAPPTPERAFAQSCDEPAGPS